MAAKAKAVVKEVMLSVKDQDHYYELMSEENKKLVGKSISHFLMSSRIVIDLYLEWCGECVAMKENFKTLWFSFDDPDTRMGFYKVSFYF